MDPFVSRALLFIERWSLVIYGVGGVALLLYLTRARQAWRQRRRSPFPIEREEASAMLRDSFVIILIVLAILATTFYIDRVLIGNEEVQSLISNTLAVARPPTPTSLVVGVPPTEEPTVTSTASAAPTATTGPTSTASPSPDPNVSPTMTKTVVVTTPTTGPPTATAPPLGPPTATSLATAIATQPPVPTSTAPPTAPPPTPTTPPPPTAPPPTAVPPPTAPPVPTTPPVPGASCATPGVQISSPGHGSSVGGTVTISGTASIPDFQFYKVEYAMAGTNNFASIGNVVSSPVSGGPLATWNAGGFPSGVWGLRLTVVDQTGNFPPPCTIYVVIL